METVIPVALTLLVILVIFSFFNIKNTFILEYQRGLLYRNGKFVRVLPPGQHIHFWLTDSLQKVDVRTQFISLPGQEVLSADNIALKVSLVASFSVEDPYAAINQVANYYEALHTLLQVNLRDVVGGQPVEDLLSHRAGLGRTILERSVEQARALGLKLDMVNLRDIMFPGELKNIFAKVVSARKEGEAALERARGETAALRSLANAAHMIEENPNLKTLRMIQMLEGKEGNTVVLLGEELAGLAKRASTD